MMVASNLRFLRQREGYTQGHLADYLKIDRSTYTYYETGKTEPKLARLQLLAELYRVTIDQLINCDMIGDPQFQKKRSTEMVEKDGG